MGEYARKGDQSIKLGTCENLFYVTREDIEALHRDGWTGDGCSLQSYLDNKAFRVALPRQYDIAGDLDTIERRNPDFEHRYAIDLDEAVVEMLRDQVDHGRMCHSCNGTNFLIPCPHGKGPHTIKTSGTNRRFYFVAEGCGNVRAIYSCGYCGTYFNLAGHEAQSAVARAFADRWCIGENKLSKPMADRLMRAIEWAPEAVVA